MRRLIAGFAAAAALGTISIDLSACGDKFLLVGRGAGVGRAYAALYPASILVFARASAQKATISDSRFAILLKQAGHRVHVVTSESGMADALGSGRYDVVLAQLGDAVDVQARLATLPVRPVLLPVLYKPSPSELATATRQFGAVLKGPDRISRFLAQIDELMKPRANAAKTARTL